MQLKQKTVTKSQNKNIIFFTKIYKKSIQKSDNNIVNNINKKKKKLYLILNFK